MAAPNPRPQPDMPAAPLTLEGAAVLHQMFRLRPAWHRLAAKPRAAAAASFAKALAPLEKEGKSALYSLLGHKGDLLLVHFRDSFEELNAVERKLAALPLSEYLEPTTSYLSVVELGLYDTSVKVYRALAEKGVAPHSDEWNAIIAETLAMSRKAMQPRLYPRIPASKYVCFYPMNRLRGEDKNFYTLPIEERNRQMDAHGKVGRRWAGKVQQIISGSIGFDDWEWGVDLFGDDPLEFKRLIYEMRFDEVSAIYALFGQFYVGLRTPAEKLAALLKGE